LKYVGSETHLTVWESNKKGVHSTHRPRETERGTLPESMRTSTHKNLQKAYLIIIMGDTWIKSAPFRAIINFFNGGNVNWE
jgi:hypothetical protein